MYCLLMINVENGSMAARAGLRPGLVIQEANRKVIENSEDLKRAMKGLEAGDSVLLLVADGRGRRYVVLKK